MPIGWSYWYFVKLPKNPFQELFPDCQPLEKFVLKSGDRKNDKSDFSMPPVEKNPENVVDFNSRRPFGKVMQHLGGNFSLHRIHGRMENSPKYEDFLIKRWLEMRAGPWQWFSSPQLKDRMIIGDLNIDKKSGIWSFDMSEYSSVY